MEAEAFSSLVNDIYDAALDRARWPGVLEKIAGFVGGSATNLFLHDRTGKTVNVYFQWGNDPDYEKLYFTKYAALNPMFPGAMLFGIGEVQAQNDVVPYREFYETRFYKEWVRPQKIVDSIGGIVEKSSTSVAMLVVRMSERDGLVDDQVRHRFSLVLPHVRRALLIGQVISFKETNATMLAAALSRIAAGVFLVDAGMKVVFANDAGKALLAHGSVVHDTRGLLKSPSREVNRLLHDLCLSAAGLEDIAFGEKGVAVPLLVKGERWLVHLLPLTSGARRQTGIVYSAVAAIFIRRASIDTPSALEVVTRLYGLTPSEARVLQAVMDIGGVRTIADTLGISQTTVKTHLQHLFSKTGARRQPELVRLVAAHASPFSPPGPDAPPDPDILRYAKAPPVFAEAGREE